MRVCILTSCLTLLAASFFCPVCAIGTPWLLLEAALLPIILLRHCLRLAAFTWYIWYLIPTPTN